VSPFRPSEINVFPDDTKKPSPPRGSRPTRRIKVAKVAAKRRRRWRERNGEEQSSSELEARF